MNVVIPEILHFLLITHGNGHQSVRIYRSSNDALRQLSSEHKAEDVIMWEDHVRMFKRGEHPKPGQVVVRLESRAVL
ncbi:MAG: hypothetical protein ACYTFG_16365 [Planctomycetota bacterium]|jgi:hypothetical protein